MESQELPKPKLYHILMRIVNIIGGLGNQMFQYAFALTLKERFPDEDIYIDTSHFRYLFIKRWVRISLHDGLEVDHVFPNANLKTASPFQLMKVTWYIPNFILNVKIRPFLPKRSSEIIQKTNDYFAYNPSVYDKQGDVYYDGIWESVSYYLPYQEKIQQVFAHPEPNDTNRNYIRFMEEQNSVGVHIRRGDYLNGTTFYGICDLDYYKKAVNRILEDKLKHVFYIFSNDIKWCEENIKPIMGENEVILVTENTGKNSCWDMFLMTHCKDLIIANSSFSWWGAFLNKKVNRVIAPKTWARRDAEFDIWDPKWIRI